MPLFKRRRGAGSAPVRTLIRRDDLVQVISGREGGARSAGHGMAGKRGKVLAIFLEKNRAIVEGVNFIYRHVRPSVQNPKGGRVQKEASISLSNLMLVCKSCDRPVRVRIERTPKGAKRRLCKKCGEEVEKK